MPSRVAWLFVGLAVTFVVTLATHQPVHAAPTLDPAYCTDGSAFHFDVTLVDLPASGTVILFIDADGSPDAVPFERVTLRFDTALGGASAGVGTVGTPTNDRWLDGAIANWSLTQLNATDWRFEGEIPNGANPLGVGDLVAQTLLRGAFGDVLSLDIAVTSCAPAPINLPVNETITVTDTPTITPPTLIPVNETISVTDTPTVTPAVQIPINESVSVSDAVALNPPTRIEVIEPINVTDLVSLLPSLLLLVGEDITVDDAVTIVPPGLIRVDEAISVTDLIALLLPLLLQVDEAISVSDTIALGGATIISLSEVIAVLDGVGLLVDDGDGIDPAIDGHFEGKDYVDDRFVASTAFTDVQLGGTTFGNVDDPSDVQLAISDARDPLDGVHFDASSGLGKALVSLCDHPVLSVVLTAGDMVRATCGSLVLDVDSGTVEVLLPGGAILVVPVDTTVLVSLTANGVLTIANLSSADGGTALLLAGENAVPIAPGDEVLLLDGCLGDVNADGVIDGKDIAIVARALPSEPNDRRWNPVSDVNRDGVVTVEDLRLVLQGFRDCGARGPNPKPINLRLANALTFDPGHVFTSRPTPLVTSVAYAGWNAVPYVGALPISAVAFADLFDGRVESVWRWDATDQAWASHFADGPSVANTLTTVHPDDALWVRLSGGPTVSYQPMDAVANRPSSFTLSPGWTAMVYSGSDGTTVSRFLGGIAQWVGGVFRFDEATQRWRTFDPNGPQLANDLEALLHLDVLWIRSIAAGPVTLLRVNEGIGVGD